MDYNSMFSEYEYFNINVSEYVQDKNFTVTRPASLNNPKDHSVMFIQKQYLNKAEQLLKVSNCLIFWPNGCDIPEKLSKQHAIVMSNNPHLDFCYFFKNHDITNFVANCDKKLGGGY